MSTYDHHETDAAVRRLVETARIEVIPLKGVEARMVAIPTSTTVTITISPKFGLERTLDHTAAAVKLGHRVVPHLAARQLADEAQLRDVLHRLDELGVCDLYVIGGDADPPAGVYTEAADVLEAMEDIDHGITSIGVGCYPEGHPKISDEALAEALMRKQRYADYMVSQLCFDAKTAVSWLERTRSLGVTLPLHIGLAAPMNTRKLAELSLRIGVGSSLRYLTKQHGILSNLLLRSDYRPEKFLHAVGAKLLDANLAIEGVHLFSFNQIEATVAWQQRLTGAGRVPAASA